jgi:hypothetical protein
MENVVPGVLQRLQAADILRMAGLNAAALGQEYCRAGLVQEAQRQGTRLFGIINSGQTNHNLPSAIHEENSGVGPYFCEVEIHEGQGPVSWVSQCTCNADTALLCPHSAALLYLWLAHPSAFVTIAPSTIAQRQEKAPGSGTAMEQKDVPVQIAAKTLLPRLTTLLSGQTPSANIVDLLSQSGLSELRGMAREYEIASNGLNKQQLVEALVSALGQPDMVRHVATSLQKPQRQLLAAVTLAGGFVHDEDLRGLFERFSLGGPDQLQQVLLALQSKAFLFRTGLYNANVPKLGVSDALLDSGWFVPLEVRAALRVTVPTTVFRLEQSSDEQERQPVVRYAAPYALLAHLLLVARALDGYPLAPGEDWLERSTRARGHDAQPFARAPGNAASDGSVAVPWPDDLPPATLIEKIALNVPLAPALLRFAVYLLVRSEVLYRDDEGTPRLRMLASAAQLFLGPDHAEVSRDLFELWLTRPSYFELFALREEHLRLRCRATALNFPVLRPGELEAENTAARQVLVALLAQVPLQQWVNFAAFARFVYRLNPLFLQRKQRMYTTPHWWLEVDAGRPLRPLHLHDWLRAEALYLARLISGPLFWWGACDIAIDRDGRLLAFRLTPVAASLFTGTKLVPASEASSSPGGSLEIVDAEEMLVACDVQNWPLIEVLETFTQAMGVRNGRLCYRLTPAALTRALGRGHDPAALLHLLRSCAVQDALHTGLLPCMLERLERWRKSYGRMRIYTGVTLLESIDTVVMRELSATTSLDGQVVQSVSPTLQILKKSGVEQIIEELKRRGQSPLVHDDPTLAAFGPFATEAVRGPDRLPAEMQRPSVSENHQGSVE